MVFESQDRQDLLLYCYPYHVSMALAQKTSSLVKQLRLFLNLYLESPIRLFISKCVLSLCLTVLISLWFCRQQK